MATQKKKYKDLLVLINYLNLSVTDGTTIADKKLQIFAKKIQIYLDQYNEKLEDIRLTNASTDKDDNLILDEKGGYKYSKEATKKVREEIRDLLEQEFDYQEVTAVSGKALEKFTFLNGWINGVEFEQVDEEENDEEL